MERMYKEGFSHWEVVEKIMVYFYDEVLVIKTHENSEKMKAVVAMFKILSESSYKSERKIR